MEQLLQKVLHFLLSPLLLFLTLAQIVPEKELQLCDRAEVPLKHTSLEELVLASIECPRLKVLALPILSPSEEVHLPKLMNKWKHLQKLEMESKPNNFTEMVKTIGMHCGEFCGLTVSGTIGSEDALAIVDHLPNIHCLDFSRSFLVKEGLLTILTGCKGLERLNVDDCVGFDGEDREVLAMASAIKDFSNKRCKLYYEHVDEECDLGSGYYFCGFVF
ncbi:hypothetical protein HPP92_013914 [Vanilla planifolia]|uniref:Uncharacterized protein n=1 Tax=Vanilla planifolia TaxID=51239 RepID=A0A835QSK6_VANPL|nr:hypothetical protein HPP92_013914 [Vanilla planifolia]